jgi:excisionase family DNA binding protein
MTTASRHALRPSLARHERHRTPADSSLRTDLSDGAPPADHDSSETSDISGLTDRLAYSVAEAALITGLSRDLLYDEMRAGRLQYLKVGRRRIITRQHLDAFLAK